MLSGNSKAAAGRGFQEGGRGLVGSWSQWDFVASGLKVVIRLLLPADVCCPWKRRKGQPGLLVLPWRQAEPMLLQLD